MTAEQSARSDEQPGGQVSPPELARTDDTGDDDCGNVVPMETEVRFPQGLGNSPRTRDSHIPTSRSSSR
jgi:hypothetical protein